MNDIIAISDTGACGRIVYWRLSNSTPYEALAQAWQAAGLPADMALTPPSVTSILGLAVRAYCSGSTFPRKAKRISTNNGDRSGWNIVLEEQHSLSAPTFTTLATVWVEEPAPGRVQSDSASNSTVVWDIEAHFGRLTAEIAHSHVSAWLINTVLPRLGAVSLRESGGIYYVPETATQQLEVVKAVLKSTTQHVIYEIPAMRSNDAMAAILDAITTEAQDAFVKLEAELTEGLGKRALTTRTEQLQKLGQKLAAYEAILGQRLDNLRSRIVELDAGIATAVLTVDAQEALAAE